MVSAGPSAYPFSGIPSLEEFTVLQIELWLLVLIRISVMVFLLPIIMTSSVPARFKAGLAFFLSIIIFPTIPASTIVIPTNIVAYVLLALREIYIGAVLGFASTFVVAGLRFGGSWVDSETGFNMMQIMNPMAEEDDTPLSHLIFILFILILLSTGGYAFYLRAISESFALIPLALAKPASGEMISIFARMSSEAFLLGMKIASPVVATLFISSVGLAIIARIMPQMNVWMVGMPMKIALGSATTIFALPLMLKAFLTEQEKLHVYWITLMHAMGS
jgi:flagellar biosynthesis protein FliR